MFFRTHQFDHEMDEQRFIFPLKYKFLGVLLMILLSALGVFFYFSYRTFSEDKRLFIMDLNLSLLRAASSEIKLELRSRLEEMQILLPRIYQDPTNQKLEKEGPYEGLSANLPKEILRVGFFRKKEDGSVPRLKEYINMGLLKEKLLTPDFFLGVDESHPLRLGEFLQKPNLQILNRSSRVVKKTTQELAVLTFLLPGSYADSETKDIVVVVDIVQDFLRKKLQQSDLAQLFLIFRQGNLLSHGLLEPTIEFSKAPYPHPIQERLKTQVFPRESFEITLEEEPYLCNLSETGFNDVLIVAQTKKSEAFLALKMLMEKSLWIAALILCVSTIISVLFASRLTYHIKKLQMAAEEIGTGNMKVELHIDSHDEIHSVARSFKWMTTRIQELIKESALKARMEDELETARLVQSTILSAPVIQTDKVEIVSHYVPASECGGDIWDASFDGSVLTIFIGDATGHGAPAAIVTAVAKSTFSTLNTIYQGQPLAPDQILSSLNQIIHSSCKGQLLMTMCIIQLNVDTGELIVCNAGHESPLIVRSASVSSGAKATDKGTRGADVLFARGERLGFDPNATYEPATFQLTPNDVIMLYTDGISEARNMEGKEWGERALKKLLAKANFSLLDRAKGQLVAAVEEHMQGRPQDDDITFVLLSWKQRKGKENTVPQTGTGSEDPKAA